MSEISQLQASNLDAISQRVRDNKSFLPKYMIEMALRTPVPAALAYMNSVHLDEDEPAHEWKDIPETVNTVLYPYFGDNAADEFTINPLYQVMAEDEWYEVPKNIHENTPAVLAFHDVLRKWGFTPGVRIVSKELVDGTVDIDELSIPELFERCMNINDRFGKYIASSAPFPIYSVGDRDQLRENPPEILITIPVAGGQERHTLPRTLRALARQSLSGSRFFVQIIHNSPADYPFNDDGELTDSVEPTDADRLELLYLATQLEKISREFPDFQASAYHKYAMPHDTIGSIRHDGTLLALAGLAYSGLYDDPSFNPLLLNLDADIRHLNTRFLENMLKTKAEFESPVISSNLLWDIGDVREHAPTAARILKLSRLLNGLRHQFIFDFDSFYDCGTAISAKEYLAAGGHNDADMFFENGNVVHAVKELNRYRTLKHTVKQSPHSYFSTSPRRQLYTMLAGHNPEMAWHKGVTTFGKVDDPVRTDDLSCPETLQKIEANAVEMSDAWIVAMAEDIVRVTTFAENISSGNESPSKREQILMKLDEILAKQGFDSFMAISERYKEQVESALGDDTPALTDA